MAVVFRNHKSQSDSNREKRLVSFAKFEFLSAMSFLDVTLCHRVYPYVSRYSECQESILR